MPSTPSPGSVRPVRREPWAWYATLVIPFVTTLWVPFYNRAEPTLFGWPFFYWYLFLWIPLVAAWNGVVYVATHARRR